MKKVSGFVAVVILLVILIGAWLVFGPATKFSKTSRYLYLRDGSSAQEQVMNELAANQNISPKSIDPQFYALRIDTKFNYQNNFFYKNKTLRLRLGLGRGFGFYLDISICKI